MSKHPYGLMGRAEFDRICDSIRSSNVDAYSKEQQLAAARLLLDDLDEVRARAGGHDGSGEEFDAEFAHLWPGAAAERHEARRIAASQALSEDEIYDALFPPEELP